MKDAVIPIADGYYQKGNARITPTRMVSNALAIYGCRNSTRIESSVQVYPHSDIIPELCHFKVIAQVKPQGWYPTHTMRDHHKDPGQTRYPE